ncbi:MAG: glycosyltransferase [Candidatus Omnitrophica bacterium]|nr:glycosyltransferase [Candidatus Omnitrophota bacterium]
MNILQVVPELNTGGVETGTLDLAKELTRHGHKAIVISNGGRLVKELTASGAIHHKLPVHEKNPITIISMVRKISDIIKEEDIDIVHARSRVPAISSFFAAKASRVPFITTCHGHYSAHIFSRVMGWGKFVIVSGNVVARHMIKNFKVPRQRIRLVPRGVDLEKFPFESKQQKDNKKEFAIGVIGRITPIKGHVYFIRAMSKVVRLMPNVKAFIIGDAPASKPKYRQELEVLVRRLSLSRYISFQGRCDDIPKRITKLDLVVMPSVGEETFGRSIIEAQATGVPVIASRIGGIIDIIKDGDSGILVPPKDWNALSDSIIRVLKDRNLRNRLIQNGRRNVEKNFSLEQMYKKTLKVYNEALSLFRVLIIKWSALGDIILSLPALKALRDKFPKAEVTLLTSSAGRELLSRYGYVDEFMIFQNREGLDGIKEILEISSELKRSSFNVSLDLQNNKKSHLLSFLSLAPRRIGYRSRKLDFFLNERIDGAREKMPPLKHQFRLLKPLGIESIPKALPLAISDQERVYAESLLTEGWVAKNQILVGINCSASQRWETKAWPIEKAAKLCDLLAQKRIRVLITGTKEDRPTAKRLQMLSRSKPLDLTGKTNIIQLAAIIKRCNLFVTSDSAPLHLAALLGVPFVTLFGPTDPKRHIEACQMCRIIYKRLKCAPCYKSRCSTKKCMEKITPEEVKTAVVELLKK